MDKKQIKETILGKADCKKEETPLCQFSTFHPDMEIVEVLLKGADIQKSFNNQPLAWVYQFCEPNWDKMLELLFKYKYNGLHLSSTRQFEYLVKMLVRVKPETVHYVLKTLKQHGFRLSEKQTPLLQREVHTNLAQLFTNIFDSKTESGSDK